MKSLKVLSALLLSCALVFSSCGTWNNTQKGAAIGVGGVAELLSEPVSVPWLVIQLWVR